MKNVTTDLAPKAIGPYSQAVEANGFVFVSGQLPIDPQTGKIVEGDIKALTTRIIDNIEAILKEAGSSLDKVVRTDVFLTDLKDFALMNEVYGSRFKGSVLPARQTIQVSALPMSSCIEISCVAIT
jgi:2-iminobutanoate/2-iminopropanoate deaminase